MGAERKSAQKHNDLTRPNWCLTSLVCMKGWCSGWGDGSVGKVLAHWAQRPKFRPQHPNKHQAWQYPLITWSKQEKTDLWGLTARQPIWAGERLCLKNKVQRDWGRQQDRANEGWTDSSLYIGMTVTRKAENYGPSKGSGSSELWRKQYRPKQRRRNGNCPSTEEQELLIQALWCEREALGIVPSPFLWPQQ